MDVVIGELNFLREFNFFSCTYDVLLETDVIYICHM